jgi:mitochondrial fission protein ELM1
VFVGGSAKRYRILSSLLHAWLDGVKQAALDQEFEWLVTTSKRTNAETAEQLKGFFGGGAHGCKLLVVANERNMDNVAYGMLALSDTVVVTEDSASMISESVSAGKRVIVLRVGNGKLARKHASFQADLAARGLIHFANPQNFCEVLKRVRGEDIHSEFVALERSRLRESLRQLL